MTVEDWRTKATRIKEKLGIPLQVDHSHLHRGRYKTPADKNKILIGVLFNKRWRILQETKTRHMGMAGKAWQLRGEGGTLSFSFLLFHRSSSLGARSVTNSPYLFTFLLFTPIVIFPN